MSIQASIRPMTRDVTAMPATMPTIAVTCLRETCRMFGRSEMGRSIMAQSTRGRVTAPSG